MTMKYLALLLFLHFAPTKCDTVKNFNFITKRLPKPTEIYANDKHFEQILLDVPQSGSPKVQGGGDVLYFDGKIDFDRTNQIAIPQKDQITQSAEPETYQASTTESIEQVQAATGSSNQKSGFFSRINSALRNQFSRLFRKKVAEGLTTTEADPNIQEPIADSAGNDKLETNRNNNPNNRAGHKIELNENDPAENRFLNIFTITQFENSRCEALGVGSTYEGTCYHRVECTNLGGVSMGQCAAGYGVCCIFRYGCGGITRQNVSYFEPSADGDLTTAIPLPTTARPPTPPGPEIDPRFNMSSLATYLSSLQLFRQELLTTVCVLTVNKRTPDVKLLRVDFIDFDIRGPTNGTCVDDRLVVTGQNINSVIPVICGYNTGQHIYIDVGAVPSPIMLQVFTRTPQTRRFRLKVSQIRGACASFMNCLQYYTGAQGTLQTFNYDNSPRGLGTPQYFNNLNYAICIRKEAGYCTMTYSNVQDGQEYPFQLVNVDANGVSLIPANQAGAEIFNCPDDFIVVNGIRLCGGKLNDGSTMQDFRQNSPVTDISGGPFILPVRTNRSTVGRGFKLFYRQNRCA